MIIRMTTFADAILYFQQLATSHVDISSYFFGDSERLQNNVKSGLKLPVLYQEPYQPVSVIDAYSDNHLGNVSHSIVIYDKADSKKFSDEDAAYASCEQIAKELIGKLLKDFHDGTLNIDLSSFKYGQAEDQIWGATRLIGCRLDIVYQRPERFIYDEDKWT